MFPMAADHSRNEGTPPRASATDSDATVTKSARLHGNNNKKIKQYR